MIKFIKKLLNIKYNYFVSYDFISKEYFSGKGNTQIALNKKIESYLDTRKVEIAIKNMYGYEYCVINNYILLKKHYIEEDSDA